MGRKSLVLMIVGLLVVLAMVALAPSAFAAQVTKIMYGQENTYVTSYTPTTTGDYTMTLSWTRADGTGAPIFPESEVDGAVWTWDSATSDPYYDQDLEDLYSGTNPETTTWTDNDATDTVYFGVMPYVGDVPWHLVVTFKPTGGSASTIIDTTGSAQAMDGTMFLPNTGSWHSSRQYWPGNATTAYADWNEYVEQRAQFHPGPYPAWNDSTVWYPPATPTDTTINAAADASGDPVAGLWYTVAPEIWPSLAVPNAWGPGNVNGKPATIAAATCPLWYTYSYPDNSVSTQKPAYMWANVNLATASKRNFCDDPTTTATVSFKFYGPSVTWVYTKGPKGAIAKVLIDGVAPATNPTVDQYAAAVTTKATTTWSGLNATAYHTITIQSSGTKNSASGGTFIYHDAFQAPTDPDFASQMGSNNREENNYDGSTTYTWGKVTYAPASGGSFSDASSPSAATAFTFSGSSVTWLYIHGPKGAIARVSIDGVQEPNVDQYAAAVGATSITYSSLGTGLHTIFITGTGSSSHGGAFIYTDGFVVGGTTYQD